MKYTNSIYLWGSEEYFDSFLKEVAIHQRDYCWKFDLPGHSFDGIDFEFVTEESMYFEYESDSFEFQESSDITEAYTLTTMHPNVEISCHAESKQANDIAWIIYLSGKRTLEGRSTYYAPEAPCPDCGKAYTAELDAEGTISEAHCDNCGWDIKKQKNTA